METPQPPDQPPYTPPPSEPTSQPAPPTDPGEVTQQHADQAAAQQQAAAHAQQQAAAQTAQQPYGQQPYYGYAQPGYQQAYPQQPYQQPYGYPQQGAYYAQPGAYYQPYYSGPDNGLATGSLVTAIISIAALVFTAGFSAPLSLIASIVSIVLGHKGKKAVDEGRTQKNRDTAVAGFWTGIAGVVLSVLAVAAWVAFFVIIAESGGEADPGDLASLWGALAPILGA